MQASDQSHSISITLGIRESRMPRKVSWRPSAHGGACFHFAVFFAQLCTTNLGTTHSASATLSSSPLPSAIMAYSTKETVANIPVNHTYVESGKVTFDRCLDSALVISEAFCLPADYRKDVPPSLTGQPIQVFINLPLSEISDIDDQHSQ